MEARIARLESDVAHLRTDVADIKVDIRSLRDKVDAIKDSIAKAQIWALILYGALAAGLLSVLGRAFGWI
jgi:chromosome segregation ATPase